MDVVVLYLVCQPAGFVDIMARSPVQLELTFGQTEFLLECASVPLDSIFFTRPQNPGMFFWLKCSETERLRPPAALPVTRLSRLLQLVELEVDGRRAVGVVEHTRVGDSDSGNHCLAPTY
jgi:hypothetical protein